MSFKESLPSNNEFETHASLETKHGVLPRSKNQLRTNQFLDCVSYCNKQKSLILANSHFFLSSCNSHDSSKEWELFHFNQV